MKPNLLRSIMVFHLYQVLIKSIFIESSLAHIKYLQWLAILEKRASIASNW